MIDGVDSTRVTVLAGTCSDLVNYFTAVQLGTCKDCYVVRQFETTVTRQEAGKATTIIECWPHMVIFLSAAPTISRSSVGE